MRPSSGCSTIWRSAARVGSAGHGAIARRRPGGWAELREIPVGLRLQKIAAGKRFRTPAVCELLIEESRAAL